MEHTRFLELFRKLAYDMQAVEAVHKTCVGEWKWRYEAVIRPESICGFCEEVIRSNGIWFFTRPPRFTRLIGLVRLDRPNYELLHPNHPHQIHTDGELCLGGFPDGISLLASPANVNDCPMGIDKLPSWLAVYWNHPRCRKGQEWLADHGCRDRLIFEESVTRGNITFNDERPL